MRPQQHNKLLSQRIFVSLASLLVIGATVVSPHGVAASVIPIDESANASVMPAQLNPAGEGPTLLGKRMRVSRAVKLVGASAIVNQNAGTTRAKVRGLAEDSDAWVDSKGKLLYVDSGLRADFEQASHLHDDATDVKGATSSWVPTTLVAPLEETFELESRAGSNRVIYLDFDGASVSGTGWNDGGPSTIVAPAFDRDGDGSAFNDYERSFIQEVWAQVSEDYAPFDVNVTTKDPGTDAIVRYSSYDNNFGSHVVITNEIVGNVCGSCAGIAYVGSFNSTWSAYYQPAWSFAFDYGPLYAALTISHEVGHNLGLSHDGKSSSAYYGGQGIWGPIMGGGSFRPIFQWSNGDYASPTNTQDDFAVINSKGLSFVSDDHGDTPAGASVVDLTNPVDGVISTRSDVDVFELDISAGTFSARISPATHSPNLDVQMNLYDASGETLLAESNPVSSSMNTQSGRTTETPTGLGAWIDYESLTAQTVYVEVQGVGEGDPATTGYSDYGSLGRYTLSAENSELTISVNGPGSVSGCTSTCTTAYTPDTDVVLTATADSGASLAYWLGACEETWFNNDQTSSCTVPVDQAREVGAVFRYNRSVTVTKSGSGTVADETYGWSINCGATCSDTDWRPYVTLVATPSAGYEFSGWTGDCTHEELRCTLLMSSSKNVLATFATENTLTVDVEGEGTVTSSPAGIDCNGPTNGSSCTHVFDASETVTLTATADSGYKFTGWEGDCTGTGTCTVDMNNARSVTAVFELSWELSVTVNGSGTITSDPTGIDCAGPTEGTPCAFEFIDNTLVELTPSHDYLTQFVGWSGACTGDSACVVTMSQARSVTATFLTDYLLTVDLTGTGSGTVKSNVSGINCTSDPYSFCSMYVTEGESVTLTATDKPGFFTDWGGACNGSSRTCTVTVEEATNVSAEFEQGESVNASASGGTVTISEGWITCNSGWCTGYKPTGSSPYLTAIPNRGYNFVGWSSACTGLGTCSIGSGWSLPVANFKAPSPVGAGLNFSCRAQGTGAKCWGDNSSGQIGNNSLTNAKKSVSVSNLSGVAAVVTGGEHACGLLNGGAVKCWGKNTNGQLGNNLLTNSKTPANVSGLSNVQSLSAGGSHTCALMVDGTVKCWGKGQGGRLGNGQTGDQKTPVQVTGIGGSSAKAVAVSAGDEHSCALLTTGAIRCWGSNSSGQLGNNSTVASSVPVAVQSVSGAIGISAGGQHTCALLGTGAVKCWGKNTNGQLGNNSTINSKTAVSVSGVSGASMVSVGTAHTCAVISGAFSGPATIKCWGSGENGRLGRGSTTGSKVPVSSSSTSNAAYVMAGGSHTCAAFGSSTFTFKCWGSGKFGQLGNNALLDKLTAVAVL